MCGGSSISRRLSRRFEEIGKILFLGLNVREFWSRFD